MEITKWPPQRADRGHRPRPAGRPLQQEGPGELSPSALLAFFRLTDLWDLRDQDARGLLGGISNGTYYSLKRRPAKTLDQDKLTRISLLLGIFKALNILYSKKLADAWVQLPNSNPMFGGESPLLSMIKGGVPAMIRVRQLVDARRGGR